MPPDTESTPAPQSQAPTQPMQHGHRPASSAQFPASLVPEAGWHFLHLFYSIDRARLAAMAPESRAQGREALKAILERSGTGAPDQMQCFAVPGHKADFGVMIAGADLKLVHGIEVAIQASPLGPVLAPSYSFYSITEVSE